MRSLIVATLLIASVAGLRAQDPGITGAWRLNPELSTPLPQRGAGDRARGGRPGRPQGGGMPGIPGMGRGPSDEDMRRARVIMRRVSEPPASLVIVRDGSKVTFTAGDGRSLTYVADSRKQEHFTGDGEFTSRSRFEGEVLVVEEDFGGGVKLTSRYAPVVSEERQRLEVTMKATGLPKPPRPPGARDPDEQDGGAPQGPIDSATRVYERADARYF